MTASISRIKDYLPSEALLAVDAGGYGWSDDYIQNLINTCAFSSPQAVRYFWLQRVNETAEYLDLAKPLTQIHQQAKEMLDYWDLVIQGNIKNGTPENMDNTGGLNGVSQSRSISFGTIERPWG